MYLNPLKFLLLDINNSWILRGNQRLYLLTNISLLVFSSYTLGSSVFQSKSSLALQTSSFPCNENSSGREKCHPILQSQILICRCLFLSPEPFSFSKEKAWKNYASLKDIRIYITIVRWHLRNQTYSVTLHHYRNRKKQGESSLSML